MPPSTSYSTSCCSFMAFKNGVNPYLAYDETLAQECLDAPGAWKFCTRRSGAGMPKQDKGWKLQWARPPHQRHTSPQPIYPISTALCSLCSLPSLCPLPPSIIHHPSSTSSSFLRQPLHFFLHPSHTRRGKLCLLYLPHHHSCPSLGHLRHELSWFHGSARKCPETRLFGSALGCCCACRDPPTSTTPLLLRCGIGPLPVPAGDGR